MNPTKEKRFEELMKDIIDIMIEENIKCKSFKIRDRYIILSIQNTKELCSQCGTILK